MCIVFGKNGVDDLGFFHAFTGRRGVLAFGFEIINMEAQDVAVFNGVGDGVLVQAALEQIIGGVPAALFLFLPSLFLAGVVVKNRRAGKAEQLCVGEKCLDGLVVVAKLRAVAFVKDKHHALLAQRFQAFGMVVFAGGIQRQSQFLNGGDDDLVGVIIGQQAAYQRVGIGIFFDAIFLKFVELLAGLAVQVFAVYHKQAFVNGRIVLEQGGRLE